MIEKKEILSKDDVNIAYYIHQPKINSSVNNRTSIKKPCIVFLHGAWGNKSVWSGWFPFFEDCVWIAPDLRAHGESDIKNLSLENTVKDIELILGQENIDEVSIVGNSYGALVAHHFYKKNKNKVKKMVLFSISAKPFLRFSFLFLFLSKLGMFLGSILPSRKKILVDYSALEHVSASRIWWYDLKGLRFYDMMKVLNLIYSEEVDLKTVNVPALLIEGKHDLFIKAKAIGKQSEQNHFIAFKKVIGTHRLMYKEKKGVIMKVKSFLTK